MEDNVILFPKWKKRLEEQSLSALKDKQYEIALNKLNKLLDYHVHDDEIYTGKLICLMELGRLQEAQNLCEELLHHDGENYYNYVHIYLTLLFQTHQYDLLIHQIELEFAKDDLPSLYHKQFKQLYDISKQMQLDIQVETSHRLFDELFKSIEQEDFNKQYRIINSLRKARTIPTQETIDLLSDEKVHPVVKTAIFIWLKEIDYGESIRIHKLGWQIEVIPKEVEDIESTRMYNSILEYLKEVEQSNPSLYELLITLLYRYQFVIYPILPDANTYEQIATALIEIGNDYFNIHTSREILEEIRKIMEQIKLCETLYLSIIEE